MVLEVSFPGRLSKLFIQKIAQFDIYTNKDTSKKWQNVILKIKNYKTVAIEVYQAAPKVTNAFIASKIVQFIAAVPLKTSN